MFPEFDFLLNAGPVQMRFVRGDSRCGLFAIEQLTEVTLVSGRFYASGWLISPSI